MRRLAAILAAPALRSHGPSCSDSPAADVGGLRARLADLARRWEAAANSASRVAHGRTGSAAAAASGRAEAGRECARQLLALIDRLED